MENNIPRVGVGAVILSEDHQSILLVKRKKAPEAGYWSLPGGKVDYMETIETAIIREIKEELNVDIIIEKLLCVTDHILPEEKAHWVAPTFLTSIEKGQLINNEPHALADVKWFNLNSLPEKLTLTTKNALKYL